ncbi:flagellar protein FlaG [Duganella sp.]|uniref:flagellar protein FlaG n=1 Tax=Duganella sp. TaxID=1904440 RepID=UPI0031D91C61
MDTSSINRLDLPSAAPAPVSVPASGRPASTETAPPAAAAAATRVPTKSELKNSVDAINRFLEDNSEVHFSIDEDSGLSVVKVIDTETKKVLRQFPSEQSLEIGKNLGSLKGMLIDSEA